MLKPQNVFFNLIIFLVISIFQSCALIDKSDKIKEGQGESSPSALVNVFIGTDKGGSDEAGARGNTNPGASTPWGMVATSPQTFDFTKTQLATGYRSGMDSIYGFSCVNLSGIGCPAAGSVPFKFSSRQFNPAKPGSSFSNQKAEPGYHSVHLNEENITVESSVTTRSAIFKLHLPKGLSSVYLDLTSQQGHIKGGEVLNFSDKSVDGYQLEGFFCGSDTMSKTFFYSEMEKSSDSVYLVYRNQNGPRPSQKLAEKPSGIVYIYKNEIPSTLQIKVGVSFVSQNNAKDNLKEEQVGFNFSYVKNQAHESWEHELGKIKVSSKNEEDKTVFYTALYHSLLMPITYSDTNGDYIVQDSEHEVANTGGYIRYSGFSLWDTYRTLHPLLTLVYPERQTDMVRTILGIFEETNRLPKWEIFGQESNIMVGDPATIVIADTYLKGLEDFDVDLAYRAMTYQADHSNDNITRRGLKEYLDLGYIAMDGDFGDVTNFQWKNGIVWGSVSTTLEFNLADFGIAQMAKKLNKKADYECYYKRSLSFLQLYDSKSGLIRPKNKDGSWYEPFDAEQALWDKMNFGLRGGPGFVEGSAWNYLFSIPHGITNLQDTMGEDKFLSQLNLIFDQGYFDMTNEPGLGFPFMYNYTNLKSSKTASIVQDCLEAYFQNTVNGLPGNDDAGTMSAWVVLAMMGMYPDTPGLPQYTFTTPSFEEVKIRLNTNFYNNDLIKILRKGPKKGRITQLLHNGKPFDYWLNHSDITMKESEIIIETEPLHK